MSDLLQWLPQTWHGWAFVAALALYIVFRESIHQWLKRASQ